MDQKQIKRNLNYFTKSDTPLYVGIGMLIVGVVLYFVTYSYLVYIIASVLAAAGLILMLIGASGRVTDADIDTCIAALSEDMEVDLVENPKFAKRMLGQIPVLHLQSYLYKEGLRYRIAKSGSIRSELYQACIVYALDTGLYVVLRSIPLLGDPIDTQTIEIPYSEIQGVESMQGEFKLTIGKKSYTVTPTALCIRGAQPLEIPMQNTADVDEFITRISRILAEHAKQSR